MQTACAHIVFEHAYVQTRFFQTHKKLQILWFTAGNTRVQKQKCRSLCFHTAQTYNQKNKPQGCSSVRPTGILNYPRRSFLYAMRQFCVWKIKSESWPFGATQKHPKAHFLKHAFCLSYTPPPLFTIHPQGHTAGETYG